MYLDILSHMYGVCTVFAKHVRGELFVRANGWRSWRAMLLRRARYYARIDNAELVNAFSDHCAIYGLREEGPGGFPPSFPPSYPVLVSLASRPVHPARPKFARCEPPTAS